MERSGTTIALSRVMIPWTSVRRATRSTRPSRLSSLVWFVAATGCGGSVTDTNPGTTELLGGGSAVGGTGGTGGTGTTTGSVGGGSCGPGDSLNPAVDAGCRSDSECGEGQFCDLENCTSPCGCNNGAYACLNLCVASCAPVACPTAISALTTAVAGHSCDVVVRIDASTAQVTSYRSVCGEQKSLTQQEAWDLLLPVSRVNWSTATPYGAANTGFLFVHESAPYDVVAVGPTTGQIVFEFMTDGASSAVLGDWTTLSHAAVTCSNPSAIAATALGPSDSSLPMTALLEALYSQGILGSLFKGNGGYNSISVVHAALPVQEFLVIIGTTPRV